MFKKYDYKRTQVSVTYFTDEPMDDIVKRVENNRGTLQADSFYNVETITLTERRVARFTARPPKQNEG